MKYAIKLKKEASQRIQFWDLHPNKGEICFEENVSFL